MRIAHNFFHFLNSNSLTISTRRQLKFGILNNVQMEITRCSQICSETKTFVTYWSQSRYQSKLQFRITPTSGPTYLVICRVSCIIFSYFTYLVAFYKKMKVTIDNLIRLRNTCIQSDHFIQLTSNFGHFQGAENPGRQLPSLIIFCQLISLVGGYLQLKYASAPETFSFFQVLLPFTLTPTNFKMKAMF